MFTYQSTEPFRFLDLPGEIRNNVYNLLLCSFDDELNPEPGPISSVSRRCPSFSASSLLRTNKQIHDEAFDYMIKRNQFIRISCRGLDARGLFIDDRVPVITTDAEEVDQFNGCVMHMTLSKPVFATSSPSAFVEYDMIVLLADLPLLCEKLDIESIMADANRTTDAHASINASIKMNSTHGRFFTPKIQESLLRPITTFVRGIANLKITGPVDAKIAAAVTEAVAKPRWTDPDATLGEIHTGVDVGKRQWQKNNYYLAGESWTYALRTLERMRHSSSWSGLKASGGEDFVNETADLYFTLHLLSAAFLQVDMIDSNDALVQRNGEISLQHLRKCEIASPLFAQHAGATWTPSQQQRGKMTYRVARCLRLMGYETRRVTAVTLIEQAAALAPLDLKIRDEKDAVLAWSEAVDEKMRLAEEQRIAAQPEERSSLWNFVVSAVVEMTS
jgi:hypothetical protein